MSLLLNLGFYWKYLGRLKILTLCFTTRHSNCTWLWPKYEYFSKHSGGSSVWPRLRTTDVSQNFPLKVTFILWVITAHGQMLKIQKRSEGKGGGGIWRSWCCSKWCVFPIISNKFLHIASLHHIYGLQFQVRCLKSLLYVASCIKLIYFQQWSGNVFLL